jgi:hypothetical protein
MIPKEHKGVCLSPTRNHSIQIKISEKDGINKVLWDLWGKK